MREAVEGQEVADRQGSSKAKWRCLGALGARRCKSGIVQLCCTIEEELQEVDWSCNTVAR